MASINIAAPRRLVLLCFVVLAACIPGMVLGGGVFEAAKPIFPKADQYKLVFKSAAPPAKGAPVVIKSPVSPFNGNIIQLAVITVAPCGIIGAHIHPRGTEHGIVISGQLKFGLFLENRSTKFVLVKAGEGVVIPQGTIHYVRNTGCTPALIAVAFDHPNAGTVFAGDALVNFPPDYLKSAFGAFKGPSPLLFFGKSGCKCKG